MEKLNQSSQFYISMLQFLLFLKQQLIVASSTYDLTPIQAMTLLLIDNEAPRPMNSFRKLYNCDASNITGIVDGLEQKNLVSRSENPEDRRIKVILLTTEGYDLQKILAEEFIKMDNDFLSPLSKDERAQFMASVVKIANFNEVN